MDDNDPITQIFPGEEDVDLYAVLSLQRDATTDSIKKSYRRLALTYHPDKHVNSSEKVKEDASKRFQQIGFAYVVLSDEKRRARYDSTGKTAEGFDLGAGEDGWDTYFEELFDRVTRGKLDEDKKLYQGSSDEIADLKAAYQETGGSLGDLMTYIPHSTHEDEARFVTIISSLIKKKELQSLPAWVASSKDEKARKARKRAGEKEAKEAEERAKELGVWDEFYGSGKTAERKKSKSKSKGKADAAEGEAKEDHSTLQALILKKRQRDMSSFFDGLANKYAEPQPKSKGKGRKRVSDDVDEDDSVSSKKARSNRPPTPELDEEEFAKLQEKLFGNKTKATPTVSGGKKGRGRKVK